MYYFLCLLTVITYLSQLMIAFRYPKQKARCCPNIQGSVGDHSSTTCWNRN